jgi:hypothetical protein
LLLMDNNPIFFSATINDKKIKQKVEVKIP